MANDLLQPVPKRDLIGIGILGLIALVYMGFQTDRKYNAPPGSPAASADPTASTVPIAPNPIPTPMPDVSKWIVLKEWTGTGSQKTSPISIDSKMWMVSVMFLEAEPTYTVFSASIFRPENPDSSLEQVLTTTDPNGANSFVYKPGTFALDITSANCKWVVAVVAPKPN